MAQVFTEFDPASPSPTRYCSRISTAEYELQASEETQAELDKLIQFLELNPQASFGMIRKKKRDELSLMSYLKVQIMTAIQGEEYLNDYFTNRECQDQLNSLKEDLISAFDYSEEAKGSGRRFSKRLANKRIKHADGCNTVPPPPPPPTIIVESTKSENEENEPPFKKGKQLGVKNYDNCVSSPSNSSFTAQNTELLQSIRSVSGRGPIRKTSATPHEEETNTKLATSPKEDTSTVPANQSKFNTMKRTLSKKFSNSNLHKTLHDEITTARKKLKCINPEGSPGRTPYQASRLRRQNETPQDEYPMFNVALVQKFRNARSPSASPSGNFSDSFFDSPS